MDAGAVARSADPGTAVKAAKIGRSSKEEVHQKSLKVDFASLVKCVLSLAFMLHRRSRA